MVLTIGRSGSSATAGMLHKMGVNMGGPFNPVDANNKYGTFEDAAWFRTTRQILYKGGHVEDYKPLMPSLPLWGRKDPGMVHTFLDAAHLFDDLRVVVVRRNQAAVVDSLQRAYKWIYPVAQSFYDVNARKLDECLNCWHGRRCYVSYERILQRPLDIAQELAEFVADGLDISISADQVIAAAEHIRI